MDTVAMALVTVAMAVVTVAMAVVPAMYQFMDMATVALVLEDPESVSI